MQRDLIFHFQIVILYTNNTHHPHFSPLIFILVVKRNIEFINRFGINTLFVSLSRQRPMTFIYNLTILVCCAKKKLFQFSSYIFKRDRCFKKCLGSKVSDYGQKNVAVCQSSGTQLCSPCTVTYCITDKQISTKFCVTRFSPIFSHPSQLNPKSPFLS